MLVVSEYAPNDRELEKLRSKHEAINVVCGPILRYRWSERPGRRDRTRVSEASGSFERPHEPAHPRQPQLQHLPPSRLPATIAQSHHAIACHQDDRGGEAAGDRLAKTVLSSGISVPNTPGQGAVD